MAKTKKGFTIIEVVLVLAIAGLIFLMVFIALPALQRSQRNTQREDDISRVLTAANNYQTNNSGKIPFGSRDGFVGGVDKMFVKRYIDDECSEAASENDFSKYTGCGDQFTDPDGNSYNLHGRGINDYDLTGVFQGEGAKWPNDHLMRAITYATCGDENTAVKASGSREFAVFYMLEGNAVSCNDNH